MKELTPLLEMLAEKLGTTAEQLWSVLIGQANIEFIKYLVGSIIFLVLFLISLHYIKKHIIFIKKEWKHMGEGTQVLNGLGLACVSLTSIGLFLLVTVVLCGA